MKKNKKVILKVLVGSRAYGLHDKNSDYDYRSVYVLPTSKILSLNHKYKGTHWLEGENKDNTSYEIGHFLQLATKCNPTILEVFKAPTLEANEDGRELRKLFPYVWNPKQAFDAFVGYGLNQRKKFLDKKDKRENKYAISYIRALNQLCDLLYYHDFKLEISPPALKERLLRYKKGDYTVGEVVDFAEQLIVVAHNYLNQCNHKSNLDLVNAFLLQIRSKYW